MPDYPRLRIWMLMAGVFALYLAASKGGLALAFLHPSASPVWPATGIALAALLLAGTRLWPVVLAGSFVANLTTEGSIVTSLAIAAGNAAEAFIGASLTRALAHGGRAFERADSTLLFGLFVTVGALVSATTGLTALALGGFVPWEAYGMTWLTWWLGDVAGALIVTPLVVLWFMKPSVSRSPRRFAEAAVIIVASLLLEAWFFTDLIPPGSAHHPLASLLLLPVLWTAVRFGPRETVSLVVLLAGIAIAGTLQGVGPFSVLSPNTSLVLLQSFMATASFAGMLLAAAMNERRHAEGLLEEKVQERTRELQSARDQDRANLQRMRATVAHLPIAALLTNEHGSLLELNQAYCAMFGIGLSPDEAKSSGDLLLERFLANLNAPDAHMQNVRTSMARKESLFDEEIHLKDGRVILRHLIFIEDEDKAHRGHLFLYRDVTRERRIDRTKSEFMSLASHQLRTPLTAIRWGFGKLDKLLGPDADPRIRTVLDGGKKASVRMAETIDTMLRISQVEDKKPELHLSDVPLQVVLEDKRKLFRAEYEHKHIGFTVDCPEDLVLRTDAAFLREILRNLIQNAIKYTPENGMVTARARKEGTATLIEIEDTGYGIPAHQHNMIFQKFYRADNVASIDTSGTGLGLYLVSLLTDLLGGRIEVRSEEGKGAVFRLHLP